MFRWLAATLAVALVISPAPASAGEEEHAPGRRWSLSFRVGLGFGDPSSAMESAMRAAGLDDPLQSLDGSSIQHPITYTSSDTIGSGSLAFSITPRWSLSLEATTRTTLGSTSGYAGPYAWEDFGGPTAFLWTDYYVQTWALVASYQASGLHLGVGPSLNRVTLDIDGAAFQEQRHTPFGLVFDAGVRLPSRSQVFLDLDAQYRFVLKVSTRPIGASVYERPPLTIPGTSLSLSHTALTVGLGFRF